MKVTRVLRLLVALTLGLAQGFSLGLGSVVSAQSIVPDEDPSLDIVKTKRVEARLMADTDAWPAEGGDVTIAIRQRIIPGWHTYWRNAGDSGEPTTIAWMLPQGWKAGPIEWPIPARIPVGPLVNFGFDGEVWLLSKITIPKGLTPGWRLTVAAKATWLVCAETCIPEDGSFELTLPVASGTPKPGGWSPAFDDARKHLPEPAALPASFALEGDTLALGVTLPDALRAAAITFFPFEPGFIKNAATQTVTRTESGIAVRVQGGSKVRNALAQPVTAIEGLLVFDGQDGVRAVPVKASPGIVDTGVEDTRLSASANTDSVTLISALGFALLGGLILNLMPCVFPILSMKALALVEKGHVSRAEAMTDGLAYATGTIVTFLGLAAAVIALRAAGESVGWGFQLQSPVVVAVLAYVLFAIGLNLSGVFQIGGGLMSLAGGGDGQGRQGPMAAFLTGVLAVVVAAPCTVPFMGAAVGFALTQTPAVTFLVFGALGLGLALPWLILSSVPGLLAWVPAPGPWMVRLKEILAFPMYASAAWLLWVLAQQTDANGLFRVMIGFVLVALAAYAWGRMQATAKGGFIAALTALLSVGAAIALIAMPFPARAPASSNAQDNLGPRYEPFSPERLAALRKEGKPVFINFTAAWCITCLFNEQVAMNSEATAAAFAETGTAYLKGDWTNRDAVIAGILRQHGRDGVPLYLYYPPGRATPETRPIMLPQILTQNLVIETLRNKGN